MKEEEEEEDADGHSRVQSGACHVFVMEQNKRVLYHVKNTYKRFYVSRGTERLQKWRHFLRTDDGGKDETRLLVNNLNPSVKEPVERVWKVESSPPPLSSSGPIRFVFLIEAALAACHRPPRLAAAWSILGTPARVGQEWSGNTSTEKSLQRCFIGKRRPAVTELTLQQRPG